MERPTRFEDFRYVGDKRNQVVHDLDHADDHADVIDELMKARTYQSFGPDTLVEARNRCYHLCKQCASAGAATESSE